MPRVGKFDKIAGNNALKKNIVKEKIGQYFNWACFGCKVQQTTETFTGAENDIVA